MESGRRTDRPQLAAALELCRRQRAMLVIAKLDRLARNVAFIANLMEPSVEFTAVDMPYANKLTLHILAAIAEQRPWDGGQPMSEGEILSLSRTARIELFIRYKVLILSLSRAIFRAVSLQRRIERATADQPGSCGRSITNALEEACHDLVPTILIEPNRLFRDGLKHLLNGTRFEVGAEFNTVDLAWPPQRLPKRRTW